MIKQKLDIVYKIEKCLSFFSFMLIVEDQELKIPSIPYKKAYKKASPSRADVIESLSLKTPESFRITYDIFSED